MSPEILRMQITSLQQVLNDLKPHLQHSRAQQEKAHYEIERQVQLAVDLSAQIGRRILLLKNKTQPETNRDIFDALMNLKLISKTLCKNMQTAAGLRNLIVHEYGRLNDDIFFSGLGPGYKIFVQYLNQVEKIFHQTS